MIKEFSADFKNETNWTRADILNLDEFMEVPFELPASLGGACPKPVIKLAQRKRPSDFFQVGAMMIASERLCIEFREADAQFEFIEVDLLDYQENRHEGPPYYFAHLLAEVDCFDFERSLYTLDRFGYANDIKKLALHTERLGATPVFQIKHVNLTTWFATDEFAARMQSSRLSGMLFLELDEMML